MPSDIIQLRALSLLLPVHTHLHVVVPSSSLVVVVVHTSNILRDCFVVYLFSIFVPNVRN